MLCAHCESPNIRVSNERGMYFCCVECKDYYAKLKINEWLDKDIAETKITLQLLEQQRERDPEAFALLKRFFLLQIMMFKQLKTRDKVLIQTLRAKLLESVVALQELFNQYVQIGKMTEAKYITACNMQKNYIAELDVMIGYI